MTSRAVHLEDPSNPTVLTRAPEDLTRGRLARLGEGIHKVVYASDHWVVKRERRPSEIIALICVWKVLRRVHHLLPGRLGRGILDRPGKRIRFLRMVFEPLVLIIPKSAWLATHIGTLWKWHSTREEEGRLLEDTYLAGTTLVPERVTFPPTRVKVGAWPGWMVVSEATERVEGTLQDRINELARASRFDEIAVWLDRFLLLRRCGWERGVFSTDHHLKNYGVVGERVVLLDAGGLTDKWLEIEKRLLSEGEFESAHVRLGLEMTLRDRPDIAERFDERWRAVVNADAIRDLWADTASGAREPSRQE
jgi:hypothetical protein